MSSQKTAKPHPKPKSRSRSKSIPKTWSKLTALSKSKSAAKKKSTSSTKAIMKKMMSVSKPTPKVCEAYDSNDADIDLISSDNVVFKVHSYRLQSVSPVFRDMISLAKSSTQQDPIHLSHPSIEHSVVVKRVLYIIYTSDFEVKLVGVDFNLVKFMIDFGRKWEIAVVRDTIRRELSRGKKDIDTHNMEHFLVALHLEDNQLTNKYFLHAEDQEWDKGQVNQIPNGKRAFDGDQNREVDYDSKPLGHHYLNDTGATGLPADHRFVASPGGDLLDPGVMPYKVFLQFPPTVLWMLSRAAYLSRTSREDTNDIMRTLLDLAYPPADSAQAK